MKFIWCDYSPYMSFVEDWIDENAIKMTGVDDGWRSFHNYWINDEEITYNENYWCKTVYEDDIPFAVIAFTEYKDIFIIQEVIVRPDFRGKGYGPSLLRELLSRGDEIIGHRIQRCCAEIFLNNTVSQKAFERAGFVYDHMHVDGDILYYLFDEITDRIKPVGTNDISECVSVIRKSFMTVANEFGFTTDNAPRFTAFAVNEERLSYHLNIERRLMYKFIRDERIVGYYSILVKGEKSVLNNLCVLPEYRHLGIGGQLLEDSFKKAIMSGCDIMEIGIVEENTVLKKWYESYGFSCTGCEKFDFFPFTCGYMIRSL